MNNRWLVASTGFALFSMFFGSGNLVFPITVGTESQGHYLFASLGILLTGVIVPFLGVLGMLLYKGNLYEFFNCFGKKGTFIFSFLALALMGPFGVLARCLTVAHGALLLLFPKISLEMTSFGLCILIFILTINKNKIVPTLGSILTPLLLISIACITFFGLKKGTIPYSANEKTLEAFKIGFFQGYQTMDLLAAFFFSQFVIQHLHKQFSKEEEKFVIKHFFKASLIGAGILSLIYLALVLLGSIYCDVLKNVAPQEMLGTIAMHSLGSFAAPLVSITIIFACLTTAIVLTSLFADFVRIEISQNKMNSMSAILLTLAIGFLISTLNFAGIAQFLGPLLEAIYPALIVLTIFNVANKYYGIKSSHWPFTVTLAAKMCLL